MHFTILHCTVFRFGVVRCRCMKTKNIRFYEGKMMIMYVSPSVWRVKKCISHCTFFRFGVVRCRSVSFRVLWDLCRVAVFWLLHGHTPFFYESKNVQFALHRFYFTLHYFSFTLHCLFCLLCFYEVKSMIGSFVCGMLRAISITSNKKNRFYEVKSMIGFCFVGMLRAISIAENKQLYFTR